MLNSKIAFKYLSCKYTNGYKIHRMEEGLALLFPSVSFNNLQYAVFSK